MIEKLEQLLNRANTEDGPSVPTLIAGLPEDDLLLALRNLAPELLQLWKAAKEATDTIPCIDLTIADIRRETNNTVHEGSVKYDCINLRNCLSYLEGVKEALDALEAKLKEEGL